MAVTEEKPASDGGCWGFFKMPFRHSGGTSSSAFTLPSPSGASASASSSVESESACHSFSVAKSFLPTKRRLKLDPATKLYFPFSNNRTKELLHAATWCYSCSWGDDYCNCLQICRAS